MGNKASKETMGGHRNGGALSPGRETQVSFTANGNTRKTTVVRPPMPSEEELEDRFNKVLIQMDLPPERAKILKNFTNEKKWDAVCDHDLVSEKDPPIVYLRKLRTYLDPNASKSSRKILGDATSTQVLRDLEISLRTNHISWVRQFLSEESRGLDVLIDYLSSRLLVMRQIIEMDEEEQSVADSASFGRDASKGSLAVKAKKLELTRNEFRKSAKRNKDMKIGDVTDDVHVCIMCLRAIMNNKFGFNMVIKHKEAINSIALSLIHKKLRTKALVLELLAAICLLKGGHTIILTAFDNFKQEMRETHRFATLVSYFASQQEFQIEFMVACMQFINIVVHSVEDMNFRVALQYEFHALGLDDCLERLGNHESDELAVQITAYVDNVVDVHELMEEADTKQTAIEQAESLEEDLGRLTERLQEQEDLTMGQQVAYENRLEELQRELQQLTSVKMKVESEYSTLKKTVKDREQEEERRKSKYEEDIKKLIIERDNLKTASNSSISTVGSGSGGHPSSLPASNGPSAALPPPPPPPPIIGGPAPPPPPPGPGPPPPPPKFGFGPPPPPGPPGPPGPPPVPGLAPGPGMNIKAAIKPNSRLPTLGITNIKPNNINGTIWQTTNDQQIIEKNKDVFDAFEEAFKLNTAPKQHSIELGPSEHVPAPKLDSLLEHTRLRNVAICKRKIVNDQMSLDDIIFAVNSLDNSALSIDAIELLQRIEPTPEEIKLYKDYVMQKKDETKLTDEDRFMLKLSTKVERLKAKLEIMSFMSSFFEMLHSIQPRISSVHSASKNTHNAKKFQKILEIILAFGNYMNSSKKGSAYGFRLKSLDSLAITKSSDKKTTIVNFLVNVVNNKYPELKNFESELRYIDKAMQFPLENIMSDVRELEVGMSKTKKELEARMNTPNNLKTATSTQRTMALKDFCDNAGTQLLKLREDAEGAQKAFNACLDHYGEDPKDKETDTNTFFALLKRFCDSWKKAEEENIKMEKLKREREMKKEFENNNQNAKENVFNKNAKTSSKESAAMLNAELKNKINNRNSRSVNRYNPEEVKDGTFEQMILDIKAKPYVSDAQCTRRSVRRTTDRLMSRNFDEDL